MLLPVSHSKQEDMAGTEKIETASQVMTFKNQSQVLFPVICKQEETNVQSVLSTTEGSHLPVCTWVAARMHRNAFRLKFARNNATSRPSNFSNIASKKLYCLQIPQQISPIGPGQRTGPLGSKENYIFKLSLWSLQNMHESIMNILSFSQLILQAKLKPWGFCALHDINFTLCVKLIHWNEEHQKYFIFTEVTT